MNLIFRNALIVTSDRKIIGCKQAIRDSNGYSSEVEWLSKFCSRGYMPRHAPTNSRALRSIFSTKKRLFPSCPQYHVVHCFRCSSLLEYDSWQHTGTIVGVLIIFLGVCEMFLLINLDVVMKEGFICEYTWKQALKLLIVTPTKCYWILSRTWSLMGKVIFYS